MIVLSQQQWFDKLKSWVPTWFFESEHYNVAEFQAIARLLNEAQQMAADHISQTFMLQATDNIADLHANERNFDRLPQETDSLLMLRAQNLFSQYSVPAIKRLVDQFLIVDQCTIIEHFEGAIFADRESFCNRREVFMEIYYNTFSIIVEKQLHNPYSFASRENFANCEDFYGDTQSSQNIFDLITKTVNNVKAAGTLYRVIERG